MKPALKVHARFPLALLAAFALAGHAYSQELQRVWSWPRAGTFYSLSLAFARELA